MKRIRLDRDGGVMHFGDDLYEGRPRRTKWSHPYAYDPFTVWRGSDGKPNGSAYSDRLQQWDYKKFDELRAKHFGESRDMVAEPAKMEAFLREYQNIPDLVLLEIQEHCNWATGYPVWLYLYRYDAAAAEVRWEQARKAAAVEGCSRGDGRSGGATG